MGADRPDADLLIDDVYTAEAEGTGREGSAPGRRPHAHPRPGSLSPPRGWLEPRPSPVEADFVETLLAGLVYGVEAGARVLLLAAVWVTDGVGAELVAHSWGPPPAAPPEGLALGARNPCTLRPSLDTRTHTQTHTPTHAHSTARPSQAARFYPIHLYTCKLTTAPRDLCPNRLKFKQTYSHTQAQKHGSLTGGPSHGTGSPTHRPAGCWLGQSH